MSHFSGQYMRPRSINIFLLNGDPEGIRVAQVSMSTIQAIAFRKLKLKQAKEAFSELTRPGVYLLLGFDEKEPDQQIAYIGESEDVAGRLQYHAGNEKGKETKYFWSDTIALVSKDESLTKSHARYVEARLIAEAGLNSRWKLANVKKASEEGKLPLPDRAAMEEFIEQTKTLVGALGCDLFKVISISQVAAASQPESLMSTMSPSQEFSLAGDGYSAQMVVSGSGELVVKKGSVARKKTTLTMPKGIEALRIKLSAQGVITEKPDGWYFEADYPFTSVSSAAATVIGASANGRTAWRLANGCTYAQWEQAESSDGSDLAGSSITLLPNS